MECDDMYLKDVIMPPTRLEPYQSLIMSTGCEIPRKKTLQVIEPEAFFFSVIQSMGSSNQIVDELAALSKNWS